VPQQTGSLRATNYRRSRRHRLGTIQQGYLESSMSTRSPNITNLIAAQRAYEMNSKVIQAG